MISVVIDRMRKLLIPNPRGSLRAAWIVESAQDEVRFTPELIKLGEDLYRQLVERDGEERRPGEPLAHSEVVRASKNPLSRRRTQRVYLKP